MICCCLGKLHVALACTVLVVTYGGTGQLELELTGRRRGTRTGASACKLTSTGQAVQVPAVVFHLSIAVPRTSRAESCNHWAGRQTDSERDSPTPS